MSYYSCCRIICALFGFIGMLLIGPIITFNMTWLCLLDILKEKNSSCAVSCFVCLFGFFSSLAYYTCFAFPFMIGYFMFVMSFFIDDCCRKCEHFDCAKSLLEPSLLGFIFSEWATGRGLYD